MKSSNYNLIRYDADEGKVFDWAEPHYIETEDGEQVQDHLYCTTLFIGHTDNINNYIEIEKPE